MGTSSAHFNPHYAWAAALIVIVAALPFTIAASASAESDLSIESSETFDDGGIPEAARDALLGTDWRESDDVISVVVANGDELEVLQAREAGGYAWGQIARLALPPTETDMWISNSCTTSSGNFLVVSYAPRRATNTEAGSGGGARAAIFDFTSGSWRTVDGSYTTAYFSPGCGAGDTVTLTSYPDGASTTTLAVVNASSGEVISRTEAKGQLTSAVADASGRVFAAGGDGILAISPDGSARPLLSTDGGAYDLAINDHGQLAFATFQKDLATVTRVDIDRPKTSQTVATGPLTQVGVRRAGDGGFLSSAPTSR